MRTPRMCQRFYCDWRGDRYCCRDCWHLQDCENPCLNDPSRCGLEDLSGRVRRSELEIAKVNRSPDRAPREDY